MPGSQKYSPNSSSVKPIYFLGSFLKKHQILSIGLIGDFSRNSVNISDCRPRASSTPFEAVTFTDTAKIKIQTVDVKNKCLRLY